MNPTEAKDTEHRTKPAPSSVPVVPPTMRAAVRPRYGGADAIRIVDVETPTVGPATVLVQVVAASVNPFDWHMLTGTPWLVRGQAGIRRPKSPSLGLDLAGRVVAVGAEVSDFRPGDEVMGMANGSFAQYVAATEDQLAHKPAEVPFDEASGAGVAAVTALQGLRDHANLQAGQRVLINGASGGVGAAAIQLAKWLGAEVTAVCSGANAELVRSLGADHVIDYTTDDFTDGRYRDREQRFHVLLDNQGNHSLKACRQVLTDDGTYLLIGGKKSNPVVGPMGRMLAAIVRFRFASQRAIPFIAKSKREDLEALMPLMAAGRLRTIIDAGYTLDQTPAAMDHLAGGHVKGKLIIDPQAGD